MQDGINKDIIEEQYINHPYPEPIDDLLMHINKSLYVEHAGLDIVWHKLFPEKEYNENIDILIAGCGTNQAPYHALKFPNSNIYAIDVSDTSINHVKKMIEKYNIKNLEIEKKDIIDLKDDQKFDYTISTGVIHHTANPQLSLNKIVDVTKADGGLYIMVYANYLRHGVYYLQDFFRYLGIKQNKLGLDVIKKIIGGLPKDHYVNNYIKIVNNNSRDLSYDAGIIDTFLNARDVSYDIFSLKELIDKSGAFFQCWMDNNNFWRDFLDFSKIHELQQNLDALNPWERADLTQKFQPNAGKFSFTLRKNKKFEHMWFDKKMLNSNIYAYKHNMYKDIKPINEIENSGGSVGFNDLEVKLSIKERVLWNNLDNKISKILELTNGQLRKMDYENFNETELTETLHSLWLRGRIDFAYF